MLKFECVCFYRKGRRERGSARPGGVSSRRLRSPKHSAGTLWLCTVAPPSPLPAARRKLSVPLGCAPSCFAEYQAILNILPKPPPECTHPLSRLFFASAAQTSPIWFGSCSTRACLKNHSCHLHSPLCVIFSPNSGYIARYDS